MNRNEKILKAWAEEVKTDLGFTRDIKKVVCIWNPGGFVNQSYFLTDGEVKRHVKFAEANHEWELRKWSRVSEYLNTYYHAPKLIKEIEEEVIPGFTYGLVAEYFEGEPLKIEQEHILTSILDKVSQLHQDKHLGSLLESQAELTYADTFITTYITRFREDLSIIDGKQDLLSFVEKETYRWFHDEVDRLEEVQTMKSFQAIARDVTHNDLSSQNILVNRENFCIIDWDDLSCQGDAAMDYSSLLWPFAQSKRWPEWQEKVREVAGDITVERLSFYFRAKLLDDVIDVLADYVEAEEMPEVKDKTQKRAKKIHLQAYQKYRLLYG